MALADKLVRLGHAAQFRLNADYAGGGRAGSADLVKSVQLGTTMLAQTPIEEAISIQVALLEDCCFVYSLLVNSWVFDDLANHDLFI